jgi:hypothetical protein
MGYLYKNESRITATKMKFMRRTAGYTHLDYRKNLGIMNYIHIPQYIVMAWCLVKHRDNLTFTLSVMETFRSNWKSHAQLTNPIPYSLLLHDAGHYLKS